MQQPSQCLVITVHLTEKHLTTFKTCGFPYSTLGVKRLCFIFLKVLSNISFILWCLAFKVKMNKIQYILGLYIKM